MGIEKRTHDFLNENFHALMHKNFRYYWLGQCISLVGTWVQNIGQSWLVLTLTGSPLLLGILGAMQYLPITIFSLFAGVLIDRYPKKKILIITQTISMVLALVLAFLVFSHNVRYSYVLVLAFLLGCTNAVDMPTRQSFTIELAGKKDLMNAIALNSATFNLARVLGPAIGAVFMAIFGPGWCFLFNGLSFIAVIYGLLKIKAEAYMRIIYNKNILKEIGDGLKYILKDSVLLQTILMVTVVGIFAFNYNILVPVFTKNILHGNERTYGLLLSALGIGSLIGALIVSMRSKSGPKIKVMLYSSIIVSIMLTLTGVSNIFYFTAISLGVTGIFNIYFATTANSTLQMLSKDEYRGRVMSVYSLVFAGSAPIGNLFAGYTADKLGVVNAFIISGVSTILLVGIIYFYFKLKNEKVLKPF